MYRPISFLVIGFLFASVHGSGLKGLFKETFDIYDNIFLKEPAVEPIGSISKKDKEYCKYFCEVSTKFPNGSIRSRCFFENGKRVGVCHESYLNGIVKKKGTYRDDELLGPYIEMDSSGNLRRLFDSEAQVHFKFEYYSNEKTKRAFNDGHKTYYEEDPNSGGELKRVYFYNEKNGIYSFIDYDKGRNITGGSYFENGKSNNSNKLMLVSNIHNSYYLSIVPHVAAKIEQFEKQTLEAVTNIKTKFIFDSCSSGRGISFKTDDSSEDGVFFGLNLKENTANFSKLCERMRINVSNISGLKFNESDNEFKNRSSDITKAIHLLLIDSKNELVATGCDNYFDYGYLGYVYQHLLFLVSDSVKSINQINNEFSGMLELSSTWTDLDKPRFQGYENAFFVKAIFPHYMKTGADSIFESISDKIAELKKISSNEQIAAFTQRYEGKVGLAKDKFDKEKEIKNQIETEIEEKRAEEESKERERQDLIEEVCGLSNQKSELLKIEAREKVVDSKSGTVDLDSRRKRARTMLYIDEQTAKYKRELKSKFKVDFKKSLCPIEEE